MLENFLLTEPRHDRMNYRRCGSSGLLLSEIALGFWHNFGGDSSYDNCKSIVECAFDNGITYFDLANNYGPPAGSAEECFGRIMKGGFASHRDEIVIATKAGHDMWPGPYGEWGSRKYLMASLDQSLRRMGLDYVDIFYSHRPDPDTPLEETMQALVDIVRSGKALYVGISKYPPEMAKRAYDYLSERDVRCLVYQGRYNMINREPEEEGILSQVEEEKVGFVAFSPLAQGLLTGKYLNGIPEGSRMTRSNFLRPEVLTDELLSQMRVWNEEAVASGYTMAQYALKWILKRPEVTSVIVGASSPAQLMDSLGAVTR